MKVCSAEVVIKLPADYKSFLKNCGATGLSNEDSVYPSFEESTTIVLKDLHGINKKDDTHNGIGMIDWLGMLDMRSESEVKEFLGVSNLDQKYLLIGDGMEGDYFILSESGDVFYLGFESGTEVSHLTNSFSDFILGLSYSVEE